MASKQRPTVTAEAIKSWGISTSIENAARCFGMSRTVAYDLLRRGEFPVPHFKVGRRIVVPTAPILRLFGVDVADDAISDESHEPPALRVVSLKDG
jgi:Helix-turn-helix domain